LGTNSLLDLLVFGRAAGNHLIETALATRAFKPLPVNAADYSLSRIAKLDSSAGGEYPQDVANDLRKAMQLHAGVFRTQKSMDEGVVKVLDIAKRAEDLSLKDKSKVFNTARIEALEVANLMESAKATMVSAAARTESRGAHTVDDYGDTEAHPLGRNDDQWLKHTLWFSKGNRLDYKPVNMKPLTVDSIPLAKRTF
jgi:succinate dehydrogenase / fumarate reductase, flavoprotein subunit